MMMTWINLVGLDGDAFLFIQLALGTFPYPQASTLGVKFIHQSTMDLYCL